MADRLRRATADDSCALCRLLGLRASHATAHPGVLRDLGRDADTVLQRILVLSRGESLVAAGRMLVEPKFLRGGRDVAFLRYYEPREPGPDARAAWLAQAIALARTRGCYKAIIDVPEAEADGLCAEGLGLSRSQLTMGTLLRGRAASPSAERWPEFAPRSLGDAPALRELLLRPLRPSDGPSGESGEGGYVSLLAQLSHAPPLEPATFGAQLAASSGGAKLTAVVERREDGALVGCGTVLRDCHVADETPYDVALIEDVVVDASMRGTGLGGALVNALLDIAAFAGARKAMLNCKESTVGFYRKCGLASTGEVNLAVYFGDAQRSSAGDRDDS